MPTQLRIYTIEQGGLEQFAAEWKEKIYPLRLALGFRVLGAWAASETSQFVWLLSYDGPESWEAKDEAYFSSPERKAMEPNPARLIARMEHYFVEGVLEAQAP